MNRIMQYYIISIKTIFRGYPAFHFRPSTQRFFFVLVYILEYGKSYPNYYTAFTGLEKYTTKSIILLGLLVCSLTLNFELEENLIKHTILIA